MTSGPVSGELSISEIVRIGRDLADRLTRPDRVIVDPRRTPNPAHYPTVYGLTRHTLKCGALVFDLYHLGWSVEIMPTVRLCYETALTAAWMSESREALAAALNQGIDKRRKIAANMKASLITMFTEGADSVAHSQDEHHDTIADATKQARAFKELCQALAPAGIDAYVLYGVMSDFAHPSLPLSDQYLELRADLSAGVALLPESKPFEMDAWLFMTTASMLWAGRALDNMKAGSPDRTFLREKAVELGVAEQLTLTPAVRRAEYEAARARRDAKRKGKKPRHRGTAPSSSDASDPDPVDEASAAPSS